MDANILGELCSWSVARRFCSVDLPLRGAACTRQIVMPFFNLTHQNSAKKARPITSANLPRITEICLGNCRQIHQEAPWVCPGSGLPSCAGQRSHYRKCDAPRLVVDLMLACRNLMLWESLPDILAACYLSRACRRPNVNETTLIGVILGAHPVRPRT